MKNSLSKYPFLVFFFFYIISGGFLLLHSAKADAVWYFNALHEPTLDQVVSYWTHLGDGVFCVILSLLLLWRSKKEALSMFVGFGLISGLVQFLKRIVFEDYYRPFYFYKNLHVVEGMKIYEYNSFPSGHSATAFFCFALLSFFLPRVYSVLFFVLALSASLSRVYLAQHFLVDTYFGAILGVLVAVLVYYGHQKRLGR